MRLMLNEPAVTADLATLYPDPGMTAGTLVLLDFANPGCWLGGEPRNLAAAIADDLAGDPLHPARIGKTANIRLQAGVLGIGAENAGIALPGALADYWDGRNIGLSIFFRFINGPVTRWAAGLYVAEGTVIDAANGLYTNAYTVTTAGVLGASPPVHGPGVAANGTAQLTFGVRYNAANEYGQAGGPFVLLDTNSAYPADDYLVGHVAGNGLIPQPNLIPAGPVRIALVNQVTFAPTQSSLNGILVANGQTVATAGQVQLRAEAFTQSALYNATAGLIPANTDGLFIEIHRLAIEDLDISGRSHARFAMEERILMRSWHASRGLLV